jgi:hypothetical protein
MLGCAEASDTEVLFFALLVLLKLKVGDRGW